MTQPIQLIPNQHAHFIGIGGAGLSPIARVLLLRGFQISGSDLRGNVETSSLEKLGAKIFVGHSADNVNSADFVIATSAVPDDHVEIVSAKEQGIPVYRRLDIISAIMNGYIGIAISGTHGKTTTTSMTIHVLTEAQQSPTYIVGGVMANTGKNADVGNGQAFVIEADEYANMFHGLRPQIAVITSVEFDHPDFFKTPDDLIDSFTHFVTLLPDDGLLIVCADDSEAHQLAQNQSNSITYGIESDAMWRAQNIRYEGNKTCYDAYFQNVKQGTITLQVPGKHNILNSLAAIIVGQNQGVDFGTAAKALESFKGTGRRFDVRAEINDIVIVDDYAHHPTAIRTTIDAARQRYPEHDLWVIWQPHTYSRTQQLWDDYLASFEESHHVIVTEIYAAREANNPDVQSENFVHELQHTSKFHAKTFDDAVDMLVEGVKGASVVLIMSAGDAPQIGIELQKQLEERTK